MADLHDIVEGVQDARSKPTQVNRDGTLTAAA
jgi:hypothetical protein